MFKKLMILVASMGLGGSTVAVVQAAERPAASVAISGWQDGHRAGTMRFSATPGATCKPKVGTRASDRRCKLKFSGRFASPSRGYTGTYSGSAIVNYLNPSESSSAAFDSGSVTYQVRDTNGKWLGSIKLDIDLGTGGVYGFPYDTSITYEIEERMFSPPGIVMRMNGWGVNQLDSDLNPIRTFIDRSDYY